MEKKCIQKDDFIFGIGYIISCVPQTGGTQENSGSVMSASVITGRDIPLVKYKKGIKDVKVRTSVAEYTVLLFSEEKVFVYTQLFSLIDSEQKESLQSYSYHDIASISTEKSRYGTHAFIIKLSSGKALSIPCCDEKAADIQGSVTTFMQLVRDKKR